MNTPICLRRSVYPLLCAAVSPQCPVGIGSDRVARRRGLIMRRSCGSLGCAARQLRPEPSGPNDRPASRPLSSPLLYSSLVSHAHFAPLNLFLLPLRLLPTSSIPIYIYLPSLLSPRGQMPDGRNAQKQKKNTFQCPR